MKEIHETYAINDTKLVTRSPDSKTIYTFDLQSQTKLGKEFYAAIEAIDYFRNQESAAAGIIAFTNFLKAGIYPPDDVLDWLSDKFQEWLDQDGSVELGKILNVKGTVSGSTPSLKMLQIQIRDAELVSEILHLEANFQISRETAAEMIERRMVTENDPHAITATTILREIVPQIDDYIASKSKLFRKDNLVAKLDKKGKKLLLARYPKDIHWLTK